MDQEGRNETLLRKYLLGELNEADEQAFEEEMLADEELSELLLAEEDELVDDYLSGVLSAEERERFDRRFMVTPERRLKLSFGDTLRRKYAKRVVEDADSEASDQDLAPEEFGANEPTTTYPGKRDLRAKDSAKDPVSTVAPTVTAPPSPVVIGPPSWWNRPSSAHYFKMAAAAVLVLAAAVGSWRAYVYLQRSQVSKGIASLREAYRDQRPTEARITELNYAPPPPTTRGPERDKFDHVALDRAKAVIQLEADEHPSAKSYHDLGRLYLAEHDYDKAIDQLEKALQLNEGNAPLHSDLGSALLEKGKIALSASGSSGKGFEDLARSLGHLNRALELNNSLLEALFNRALVYTEMALREPAAEDWRRYLEKDSSSAWATEARQHLRSLEEIKSRTSRSSAEILEEFLDCRTSRNDEKAWKTISQTRDALSGTIIWEQLAERYLEASVSARTSDAINNLEALRYLGELELNRAGDAYISGLAQFYKSSSRGRLERVAVARRLIKIGRKYFLDGSLVEATNTFNKCKQEFAESGDRWEAEFAEQWIGYCYLQSSLTRQSWAVLSSLTRRLEREDHRWLLMRALHLLSGAEYNLGVYSKAIEDNNRSLALAKQIGDAIGIFNASSILAEQYRYIDNGGKSLGCIGASLSSIDSCALTPSQVAQYYAITASCLMSSGLYPAAIGYQKEALRLALEVGRPRTVTIAYTRLGQIYGKAGNHNEGIRNAKLAYEAARSLSDEGVRNTMMALSCLAIGDLYREAQDFKKAIEVYDQALGFYDRLDFQYGVYEAHKNILLCYLSTGDDSAAEEELKTTLSLIENHRFTLLEGDDRNHFFDNAQEIYDIAIDFAFSKMHDPRRAFELSEQSRSRSLLDSVRGDGRLSGDENNRRIVFDSSSDPLKLSALSEGLPKRAQIIQYAVLNDKVLICVFSKTQPLSIVPKQIAQYELNEKVRGYLQILTSSAPGNGEQAINYANELFDLLIRPVEDLLDRAAPLYIVPDKILCYLPFGALRSRESTTFFIEDYIPVISPSSTLVVICSEIAAKKRVVSAERILSVGNPRFDRLEFPDISDLPSAAVEAKEVARHYESRCVLVGDAARESRVKAEMQTADVIHLAVHTILDERSPLHSKLLLTRAHGTTTDEPSSDGVLEAQEIYGLDLARAKVVLLSACQTGVERYYRGEGMISFARPFLSKGVPLVVVSLWKIEDEATMRLMASVHEHRKQDGVSTAEALALAQREMIRNTDEKDHQRYCWAAFVAIGGTTTF